VREARRALTCGRQAGRKFIEAVNARDFFDQINFAFDLGAPGRLGAFPCSEERAFRAAVLIDRTGAKPSAPRLASTSLSGTSRAHDAKDFCARHVDFLRGALAGIKYQQRQRAIRHRQAAESIQPRGARQARPFPDRRRGRSAWMLQCANFRKRAARRMATGSNQAHSIKTFFVENEISVSAPPMIPPMPTAREPSPSLIMQMFESSWRSIPSRVRIFSGAALPAASPGLARRTTILLVANFVVIESVQRVAELEHHVIRNIDDVANAGDAGSFRGGLSAILGKAESSRFE